MIRVQGTFEKVGRSFKANHLLWLKNHEFTSSSGRMNYSENNMLQVNHPTTNQIRNEDGGRMSFFPFHMTIIAAISAGPKKNSSISPLERALRTLFMTVFAAMLMLVSATCAQSQDRNDDAPDPEAWLTNQSEQATIPFYLKNKSALPKKITFIIYRFGEEGNNTIVKRFLPFQRIKFELPEQSTIYLATDSQIGVVMSGERIDNDPPFLTVQEAIRGTRIPLRNLREESKTGVQR
jgi:hypothetical protein